MAKRRLISLLPQYNQTDDLRSFFGCTVDEVFQPGTSQPISGYIGRKPSTIDPSDFYIGEPNDERSAYQLESGMVSYDASNTLTDALTYPDFVGYLLTSGADVSDHQRLFETEYYSWAPPINIDMLVNYRNYFWFGDRYGDDDLPTLTLNVPTTIAAGNGTNKTFVLPASTLAVPVAAETPAVYVNNIAASFQIVGKNVVLDVAPAKGATVIVARVPSLAAAFTGQLSVNISDLNSKGVDQLSSGMRVMINDAFYMIGAWDAQPWDTTGWDMGGNGLYMVDGVGSSIRLTSDSDMLRGIEPQYVTIDRSSNQTNMWSLYNFWVHRDTLTWADTSQMSVPMQQRQASRPIIEFLRDMIMWWDSAILAGNANPGSTTMTFTRALPDLTGRGVNIGGQGLTVTKVDGATITLSAPISFAQVAGNPVIFFQVWSEAKDPLFMLYDVNGVQLNDPTIYPGSAFNGNRVFGYKPGTGPVDPVLHRSCAYDDIGTVAYILFSNDIVQQCSYTNGVINGLYAYKTYRPRSVWNPVISTTLQGKTNGFYDVPLNLQANPTSDEVQDISQAQWTKHFTSLIAAQTNIQGAALGRNNYRDTARDLTLGTGILQHRAPLLKAMLLAADTSDTSDVVGMFDLPQAIHYAEQEYNRFRNKFIRKLIDLRDSGKVLDSDPPNVWVTTALTALKREKNNQFPFALNSIAGGQYFIPPTPTCLGVLPAAVPAMVSDTTYHQSLMILGHDGSLTPAYNDWRDPILLTLERTIYNNLPKQFRTEARPGFDVQQWIGGRFYEPFNGYTQDEVSQMMAPSFELWAQQNRLDYRTNGGFNDGDPFTWNYRGVIDRNGKPLPGNWRAIYRWYYGTDVPHLRPWEMLGFVNQPSWWRATYGPAPYKRTNVALWQDLETGTIRGGPRQGVDDAYARVDLGHIIPVDANGKLLDPVAVGIVLTTVTADTAARSWLVGDQGPVENVWHISPSYRFALANAGFLMKPARMVEQCWDVLNIGYVGQQWVDLTTLARPRNDTLHMHGEIVDGATIQVTGISQWLADYLRSSGHGSDNLGAKVRGLDVRLIHRMAGFTSNDDMKVVAESFGLLPIEDVQIILYTSPSTHSEMYSGVILEWTGRSWRALGYDARNPYFTVIPPDVNGPKGLISLATANEPAIIKWRANTYFAANVLAEHENSVWECQRGHTSSMTFEQNYWKPRHDLSTAMIRAPRVVTYQRGLSTTTRVLYGQEMFTYQQVADFLLGWQRWLVSRGWQFTTSTEDGQLLDWSLAVREFLTWAQVQWAPGNFIALSPGQHQLNFNTPTSTILNVEDNSTGFFGLADRSGRPIGSRNAVINRLDGAISLHGKDRDIFAARLAFADTEHALVFSNITIFDDNIYLPLYNLRQTRLRLICNRARDWTGRLDAPGYIVAGDKLRSDFEKATEDVRLMYDIEMADRRTLRTYAQHVIGFQSRDYLQNLLLSDIEQFEFYQGMIQQKGAPGVFQKLMRSNRASSNSNLQFLEEWAIRISEFGAPLDPFFTCRMGQTETRDDPQLVRMVPTVGAPPNWIVFSDNSHWVDRPDDPAHFFTPYPDYAPAALPTAGPVRLSDTDFIAFSLDDLAALYQEIIENDQVPFPTGSTTWIYERADHSYTVLHSFDTGPSANRLLRVVSNNDDPSVTTRLYFQFPLTLTSADVGNYLVIDGLSNSDPELQGIWPIKYVYGDVSTSWLFDANLNVANDPLGGFGLINGYVDLSVISNKGFDFSDTPANAPTVRVLREVRFPTRTALLNCGYVFAKNDLAWLDNIVGAYYGDGIYGRGIYGRSRSGAPRWAVMQFDGKTWNPLRLQPHRVNPTAIAETVIYSAGTKLVDKQMIIDQPVVDEVTVIDPLSNLLAGIADRDIDFKTDYDPARYNAGNTFTAANAWGPNEVGRVWWNLSTVKFLEPYTDIIGVSADRDVTELSYRITNWSHIAPKTSVDLYEWIASNVPPSNYAGSGTVYNSAFPAWTEHSSIDMFGRYTTIYYFWVTGLTTTPLLPFRHTDLVTLTQAIENPAGLDLPWMAPITPDAMIVSGVAQFLDDTTTMMKVRLTIDPESAGRHDEYQLLRQYDETSLPSTQLWQKLRDSLSGINDQLETVPDPSLSVLRATGIRPPQNMFVIDGPDGTRSGLLASRQSFVGIINTIFRRIPFMRDRQSLTATLYRSTPLDPSLLWAQADQSYCYEPPPRNEWDIEVFSIDQRNRLLAREDFRSALTSNTRIRVLINGYTNPLKQWSIWQFDPPTANTLIRQNPTVPIDQLLVTNADTVFDLAASYEFKVTSLASRDALALSGSFGIGGFGLGAYGTGHPLAVGQRVLLQNATEFWSIWKFLPDDPSADSVGFVLWRMQTYRTKDFITTIDWYQPGYTATNPPVINYPTLAARNATEGRVPTNQFVRVDDDGTGGWIWTQYDFTSLQWTTVAVQAGTLALSSSIYDPSRVPLTLATVANRDATYDLRCLVDVFRYGGLLTDVEINEVFFSLLNFVHTQQNNVDWAFKTSFMSIVGYNVPLQPTPILLSDQTSSLLDYVNEVKPYHVKVREFSTQFNLDTDQGHVNGEEAPACDITLLFDRCTFQAWDVVGWDNDQWDAGERTSTHSWQCTTWDTDLWDNDLANLTYVFAHTKVTTSLVAPSPTLEVNDIRLLIIYPNDQPTNPNPNNPLLVRIGGNMYSVIDIETDETNVSTTVTPAFSNTVTANARRGTSDLTFDNVVQVKLGEALFGAGIAPGTVVSGFSGTTVHLNKPITADIKTGDTINGSIVVGLSGRLTCDAKTPFTVQDGKAGNLVEAIIPLPDAAQRIIDHYRPSKTMPPLDLTDLLDLDAPYNHGQPEERIQVTVSDSYHTTVTDIGPDGRPIVRKSVIGVAAVAKIGIFKVRVDDTLRLTGVRSISGIGQIGTHVSAYYGQASYGMGGYNTPDSGKTSNTTFEIGTSAIGGIDSIGETTTTFTIGPSTIGGAEKLG